MKNLARLPGAYPAEIGLAAAGAYALPLRLLATTASPFHQAAAARCHEDAARQPVPSRLPFWEDGTGACNAAFSC